MTSSPKVTSGIVDLWLCHYHKSEKWMAYRDFKSLAANIQNELEDAVVMRIQALFIKENRLGIW